MKECNTKKHKKQRANRIDADTLLVTVDIGKVKNTGYCRCPSGTDIKPFEFFNNATGFNRFWQQVYQIKTAHNLREVVVGYESTGPYAEPLLHFLKKRGVRLVQVNPMHTKRLKELEGNSPGKTDQKDPKVIADIIELGHALTAVIPEGESAELRRLTSARERAIKRRTALSNHLQELVFIIFPEFLSVMKDVKSKSSQYLLKNYPRPEDIKGKNIEELSRELKKVSNGRIGKDRAEALYKAAEDSIGVKEGQKSIVLEIREHISTIEATERFIAEIEKAMDEGLKKIPYSRSILSIKGIGKVITAGIIGEIGDFRHYGTISTVIKLAGLDLYEISSGKRKGKKRISKRGRSLLRKLLFFAALNTSRRGGVMYEDYQRYLERGKPRNKALVAISCKLLRIIFALVRDHSTFIKGYTKIQYQLKEAA